MFEKVRRHFIYGAIASGLAVGLMTACDDPAEPIEGAGDPENIPRVTITLVGGGVTRTSFRSDPDGSLFPQPISAASATLALAKGVTYNGTITLVNDLDPNNIIAINDEVFEERDFHRFVYTFDLTGGGACNGISVADASLDTDSNGQPVGLTYQVAVTAGAASTTSCNMHVVLRHFDGVPKSSTVFDTDIDITFPVSIS